MNVQLYIIEVILETYTSECPREFQIKNDNNQRNTSKTVCQFINVENYIKIGFLRFYYYD